MTLFPQDFLKSANTLDSMPYIISKWEINHKNLKEYPVLRVPAGDIFALLKKDDIMAPEIYDFKQSLDIRDLNSIPHITIVAGNFVDRSTFKINDISTISKIIDITQKGIFYRGFR